MSHKEETVIAQKCDEFVIGVIYVGWNTQIFIFILSYIYLTYIYQYFVSRTIDMLHNLAYFNYNAALFSNCV